MNKLIGIILAVGFAVHFMLPAVVNAQPTLHGDELVWTAATQGGDTHPISGYNVYRCLGTCAAISTAWLKLNSTIVAATNYLDPSSNLTVSTTYSYATTAVDSAGDESGYSNIITITTPATFPVNPNPPTALSVTVQ
jgi:hypothetical protein